MKKIYTLFCLGLLFMAACEELVEVDYPSNQIGTIQVFEDLKTANSALAYLYSCLRDNSVLSGTYDGTGSLLGSYTDDLVCYYYDQNGLMDIHNNLQQQTNTIVATLWNTAYKHIYYANSIIYGTESSITLSVVDQSRIKGEALLVRSLIFFYLQQLFGDIPYTTNLDYEYNRSISKTEVTAISEQLVSDVTEAIGLLEDEYREAERIYPNRKVAQLLLARIYLHQSEWLQAQQMAETILESPLYQFQPDINEVFHKSGNHILWQLKPQNSGDPVKEASLYYFSGAAPNSYVLSQSLTDTFAEEDLRKQNWMTPVTSSGQTWYIPFKYKNRISGTNTNEYSVLFRLEEVYLIMAEALAQQNHIEEALPYLNATRERAGLTGFTSLSYEDFIEELLSEKRREFFTESGHRFIDLKRLDRLDELSDVKLNWEEYKQVWPLPLNELLMNPNLSPQNTGY
jgi:hypothetical protein